MSVQRTGAEAQDHVSFCRQAQDLGAGSVGGRALQRKHRELAVSTVTASRIERRTGSEWGMRLLWLVVDEK